MSMHFSNSETARSVIEQIKNGKITNTSKITMLLNQIINDLKGTDIAKEASDMLNSIFN